MVFILKFFNGVYACVGVLLDLGLGTNVEGEFFKELLCIRSLLWGESRVKWLLY